MSIEINLTGRGRFRALERLFLPTVLVLQVEERHKGFYTYHAGGIIDTQDVDCFVWRDATVEDLTNQELDLTAPPDLCYNKGSITREENE